VLFDKIASVYFVEKNVLIFLHWKWPAEGTGTVPIVSAHFRSLLRRDLSATAERLVDTDFCCWQTAQGLCAFQCVTGCNTILRVFIILWAKSLHFSNKQGVTVALSGGGSVAEWLACWTQAQKGRGFKSQSQRCPVTLLGKLFTPIVPLFTRQQNW